MPQRGPLRRWLPVVALFVLFAAPLVAAYLWRPGAGAATTNYGQLIEPPRPIINIELLGTDDKPVDFSSLGGKWTLLYFGEEDCDAVCSENLYKIERVRLTQNKNVRRVQGVYIVPATVTAQTLRDRVSGYSGVMGLRASPGAQKTIIRRFEADGHGPIHERVYFIDPLGNVMMSYPADADPTGMRKDLARLLKASHIG